MPLIHVEMLEGRSTEQVAAFTREVTEATVHLGAEADTVVVRFAEYSPGRMGRGGILAEERSRREPEEKRQEDPDG